MSKLWCECPHHYAGEYADESECWCDCEREAEQQAVKLEYMKAKGGEE